MPLGVTTSSIYPIKQTHHYLSHSCYGRHDTIHSFFPDCSFSPVQEEGVRVMVRQTYNVATPKRKRIKSALHSMKMMM
jgi:hypothetical protein